MLTILGDLNEEVHGFCKACDRNQLCNQCFQLCVCVCVCVCVISAMGDWNCSPGGSATVVKCKSQCGVRVTSGGE